MTRPHICIALLALTACASPELEPAVTARLERALDDTHAAQRSPGAVILVEHEDGRRWYGASGVADQQSGRALAEPQPVRSASIGKTFTGALVLALHEEGTLSLDDPVARFLDDVPNGDRITLRMLLQHSSGVPNYTRVEAYRTAEPGARFTYEELVEMSVAAEPSFAPGEGWDYSNTGYIMLGLIVEALVGRPIEVELRARFFEPLGMVHTRAVNSGLEVDGLWTGYRSVDGTLEAVGPGLGYAADGGAWVTTVEDLVIWAHAFFGGALHSAETLEAARVSAGGALLDGVAQSFGLETGGYGGGLIVATDTVMGEMLAGAGNGDGARTFVGYLPASRVAFAVAVNVGDGSVPIVETLSAAGPIIDALRESVAAGELE